MNRLVKFKVFESEEMWEKIPNLLDYVDLERENFSDREIDKLTKIISEDYGVTTETIKKINQINVNPHNWIFMPKSCSIKKYDDGWFVVKIVTWVKRRQQVWNTVDEETFKVDQWDGLVGLLKEKGFIQK